MSIKNLDYPKNILSDLKNLIKNNIVHYEKINVLTDFIKMTNNIIEDKEEFSYEQFELLKETILSMDSNVEKNVFYLVYMMNEKSVSTIQNKTGLKSHMAIVDSISKILKHIMENDISKLVYGKDKAKEMNREFSEWLSSFPLETSFKDINFSEYEQNFFRKGNIHSVEPLVELIKIKPDTFIYYITNFENDIDLSIEIIEKLVNNKFLDKKYLEIIKAEN